MTQPLIRSLRKREQGVSLVELLVALTILAIVVSQLMFVLITQNRIYASQEQSLDAQGTAQLVMEMILTDLRVAGFLVAPMVGVSSIDGGTSAPDALCTSNSAVMTDARVAAASGPFPRATFSANVGAGVSSVSLNAASMDIDLDGNRDFAEDGGIIISDGTGSHCARIRTIAGNVVNFTPPTPTGFSAVFGAGRAVPAFIYEVSSAGLRRNNVLLSPLVENLQIEFGVDADDSGELETGEFPIHSLNASNPAQVAQVRVSVITRTQLPNREVLGAGLPAAGNHTGSAPDGFVRRRLTATVVPRNLEGS